MHTFVSMAAHTVVSMAASCYCLTLLLGCRSATDNAHSRHSCKSFGHYPLQCKQHGACCMAVISTSSAQHSTSRTANIPVRVIVLARHILLLKLWVVLLDVSHSGCWFADQRPPLLDMLFCCLLKLVQQSCYCCFKILKSHSISRTITSTKQAAHV